MDSTNSLKARVACAQIILRLLPTPNFSLLIYLVAFLSQMPLFPENKLSLATVSGIFGAMIMSPRPSSRKKSAKGEMVISGPGESVDSARGTAKKGEEALRWLLEHWSMVADGLLDADFDVDPSTVLDRDAEAAPVRSSTASASLAPTLNVVVPQDELHIQYPVAPEEPTPLAPPVPLIRDAQAPPLHDHAWSQRQPFSPVVEQHIAELDSTPHFRDLGEANTSQHSTPVVPNDSTLGAAFASPGSRASYKEESGPPTPQKEFQQSRFLPTAALSPSQPDVEDLERPVVAQRDQAPVSPGDSNDEPPRLSPTHSSASSENSISIKTPPQSASTPPPNPSEFKTVDADMRPVSMRDTSVLDDIVDFDGVLRITARPVFAY